MEAGHHHRDPGWPKAQASKAFKEESDRSSSPVLSILEVFSDPQSLIHQTTDAGGGLHRDHHVDTKLREPAGRSDFPGAPQQPSSTPGLATPVCERSLKPALVTQPGRARDAWGRYDGWHREQ